MRVHSPVVATEYRLAVAVLLPNPVDLVRGIKVSGRCETIAPALLK
jgi:hypothetical protein